MAVFPPVLAAFFMSGADILNNHFMPTIHLRQVVLDLLRKDRGVAPLAHIVQLLEEAGRPLVQQRHHVRALRQQQGWWRPWGGGTVDCRAKRAARLVDGSSLGRQLICLPSSLKAQSTHYKWLQLSQ